MPPFSTLLPLFRDIVFLRRGPQELPHSTTLLALLVGVTLALYAALAERIVEIGIAPMAFSLLLGLALPALALQFAGKSARFVQTATALLGAGILLTLLAIPVLIAATGMPVDPKHPTRGELAIGLLALLFRIWDFAITGHILRHALDVRMPIGVLIAIAFFVLDQFAARLLFQAPAG